MGSTLSEVLGEAVRALVDAQVALDQRAADTDRWDREGLPPVALAYAESRLVLAVPVRAHAVAGANGAVTLAPVRRRNGESAIAGRDSPASVVSLTIGLKRRTTNAVVGRETDGRTVDADRTGAAQE